MLPRSHSQKDASRSEIALRSLAIAAFRTRRLAAWAFDAAEFPQPQLTTAPLQHLVYSTRISLKRTDPNAHPVFEAGKVHNIHLAAPAFDGLTISHTRPFSFWRTLGRMTAARGFKYGMELSAGCIVPAIGGGICLLARALFQAAVFSGMHIDERHGHSLVAVEPPPGVPFGFDASVLWPYIDVRFRPYSGTARFSVRVQGDALIVSVTSDVAPRGRFEIEPINERVFTEGTERYRSNTLVRLQLDARNRWIGSEVIAVNRSRLLTSQQQGRSCLTCNESACHSRVVVEAA